MKKFLSLFLAAMLFFPSIGLAQWGAIGGKQISTVEVVEFTGACLGSVAPVGKARMCFDPVLGKLQCSQDGGAYTDCVTAAGSPGADSIGTNELDDGADTPVMGYAVIVSSTDANKFEYIPFPAGTGTVTSVGLSMPAIFSVSGSPVTTSGTLAASLATQTANYVWAGPASGAAATPAFRALVLADIPDLSSVYQPLSSNLTTYAGITPSANVQSLLAAADYAAMRTLLGLVIGTNVQAYDADLSTYAGITPSANVQSVLSAADYAAIRTLLGLVIGTNVQAYDADLTTYAGITPSANVQSVLSAADYAAIRTLLGLVIGTNVQAYDADLSTLASPTAWRLFYSNGSGVLTELALGTSGQYLKSNGATVAPTWATPSGSGSHQVCFIIDGGGSAVTTGAKAPVRLVNSFTAGGMEITADQSASCVVDVWCDSYANYPPTDADSITASAVPTLSSATKNQDLTLSGWTTAMTAGDYCIPNVDSCSTATRVEVCIYE